MKITGARAVVECLKEQGVEIVFGYPGGANMPLYDALYDAPFRHVLTVHEQGAAHAADGYARASGRTGVCIATSGPGATNLVTGLATAYLDSSPVVAITGQVTKNLIGQDAFQEVDICGITMAITKHNFLVMDVKQLPEIIRQAFRIAGSGRPGPVLVDIPKDVQLAEIDFIPRESIRMPEAHHLPESTVNRIDDVAEAVNIAKKPVMIVGGGAVSSDSQQEIISFAETCDIPVVSTLMGLGSFPASHPQFMGLTGMHGHRHSNNAICNADLIVAVGSRFSDRVTGDKKRYVFGKSFIHIDVDPAEIDKNVVAHFGLVGDIKQVLKLLNPKIQQRKLTDWWNTINGWKESPAKSDGEGLGAPWIMRHISERTADMPAVFVTDVGQQQMWAAQNLKIEKPRTWLTSGGLGTMGFGLPAAIGAQSALPKSRVILIAGDGGFKMTGMELFTASTLGVPIVGIIVNNRSLGMVRQWQELFFNKRYSSTLIQNEFHFEYLAKACGVNAACATTKDEFKKAFAAALQSNRPEIIVAEIPTYDLVSPMVAPGASLDNFVDI